MKIYPASKKKCEDQSSGRRAMTSGLIRFVFVLSLGEGGVAFYSILDR